VAFQLSFFGWLLQIEFQLSFFGWLLKVAFFRRTKSSEFPEFRIDFRQILPKQINTFSLSVSYASKFPNYCWQRESSDGASIFACANSMVLL
jgi:hypothetical protein